MPDRYPERDIEEELPIEEVATRAVEVPVPQAQPQFVQRPGYAFVDTGNRLSQFPIPRPQRDPMEEMRKTINAIQFQKANDAYKAALSFQAARAYRQDLEAGKSQGEALARWGHLLPGGLAGAAAMTRESRPIPAPAITNIGGRDILRSGRFGERATMLPAPVPTGPVQTQPLIGTDDKPIPGVRVARGQSGALHIVKEAPEEAKASPALNFQMLKTAIATTEKELGEFTKDEPEYKPLKDKLDGLKAELEGMRGKKSQPKATAQEAPRDPKQREVNKVYVTPRGELKWTGTGWIQP